MSKNPSSTVQLCTKIVTSDIPHAFDCSYICLEACKRRFKARYRPIIVLDGCLLLRRNWVDENNAYFIIAYAFMDSKSKDTWLWFLTRILEDLGDYREHGWNFVAE